MLGLLHPLASRTRWTRSSTGTRARAGSSAAVLARASTSPTSAGRWSRWPRAAPRPGRSRSCAGRTRGPARSSPAARRAARPRWSCSTSTIPDIREFIWCKAKEEDKAAALRDAGFDMSIDGDGFHSIQYQNANNSVRVSDEFMHAVEDDADWHLIARTTGEPVGEPIKARELMREIAEAAWRCADPGVQYDTTINQWHTSPNSGRINASNPCSEYMHVDDSACNLASLNLMKFRRPGRLVRRRDLPAHGRHHPAGAGDRRLAVELPDQGDRRQRPRVPPARHRLRQPRRAT